MNSYQVLDFKFQKIKVHKSSETCGQSLIQEAECEINEILHEIKNKEHTKVKHLNNDTVEKKTKKSIF